MGAFKNEKNGTWYVQFRYTDWQGLRQQKLKRGFATKREAQEWERAFLTEKKSDVTMPFKTFTELYEKDVRPKLKENTWLTKEHIIKTKILPYFEHKRLCDISAKDVITWQNEIRKMTNSSGEPLSQGYLKTIHNQLYGLKITELDGEVCLHLDKGMGTNYITMFEMFTAWKEQDEKLKNGEISKEEYDRWRYNYPKNDIKVERI